MLQSRQSLHEFIEIIFTKYGFSIENFPETKTLFVTATYKGTLLDYENDLQFICKNENLNSFIQCVNQLDKNVWKIKTL